MNDENLISLATRTQREKKKIAEKGAEESNKVQKHRKKLAEAIADIVYSPIKLPKGKRMLAELGIEGDDYLTAMLAAIIAQAIKKGDMKAAAMVIELLEKTNSSNENPEEEKSFQNLIGAIKDV